MNAPAHMQRGRGSVPLLKRNSISSDPMWRKQFSAFGDGRILQPPEVNHSMLQIILANKLIIAEKYQNVHPQYEHSN